MRVLTHPNSQVVRELTSPAPSTSTASTAAEPLDETQIAFEDPEPEQSDETQDEQAMVTDAETNESIASDFASLSVRSISPSVDAAPTAVCDVCPRNKDKIHALQKKNWSLNRQLLLKKQTIQELRTQNKQLNKVCCS